MDSKMIVTLFVLLLCIGAILVGIKAMGSSNSADPQSAAQEEKDAQVQQEKEETQEEKEKKEEPQEPNIDLDEWNLLLANPNHPLPDDFEVETEVVQGEFVMDKRAAPSMKEMIEAAKEDGIDLMICSAYRSIERQKTLFNEMVQDFMAQGMSHEDAVAKTATIIAVPGTSEHHTGLAADIVTPSYQSLDEGFGKTPAGKWLMEHAADYGFILRYPKDKQDVTQIIYESWHYRYVGKEHAKTIKENGLCLEEYLEQMA